jgi:hypothetical protein
VARDEVRGVRLKIKKKQIAGRDKALPFPATY